MVEGDANPSRKDREREYHNEAFSRGTRASAARFYALADTIKARYEERLIAGADGSDALEYGCGPGGAAYPLAKNGARVTGIDISDVAIEQARRRADDEKCPNTCFKCMDAEKLTFGDESFDIVCGSGILHHLDLSCAMPEIARVMRPDGFGLFVEPLGHNPLINWYRRRTPSMRTVDEHPLLMSDFRDMKRYFGRVDVEYYVLFSLGAVLLRNTPLFGPVRRVLDAVDSAVLRLGPVTARYAWMALITFSEPRS